MKDARVNGGVTDCDGFTFGKASILLIYPQISLPL
jgi:hypothetical protein